MVFSWPCLILASWLPLRPPRPPEELCSGAASDHARLHGDLGRKRGASCMCGAAQRSLRRGSGPLRGDSCRFAPLLWTILGRTRASWRPHAGRSRWRVRTSQTCLWRVDVCSRRGREREGANCEWEFCKCFPLQTGEVTSSRAAVDQQDVLLLAPAGILSVFFVFLMRSLSPQTRKRSRCL